MIIGLGMGMVWYGLLPYRENFSICGNYGSFQSSLVWVNSNGRKKRGLKDL